MDADDSGDHQTQTQNVSSFNLGLKPKPSASRYNNSKRDSIKEQSIDNGFDTSAYYDSKATAGSLMRPKFQLPLNPLGSRITSSIYEQRQNSFKNMI